MLRAIVLLACGLMLLSSGRASATAQMPENLIYKGKTYALYTEPLERYFTNGPPTYWEHAQERPREFQASCTGCWRGYIGTWEIKKGTLYLVKLEEGSCGEHPKVIPLTTIFKQTNGPIRADWYSGVLRLPQGKLLEYVHMGFFSDYEKDLFIAVRHGKVIAEKLVDNRKPRPEDSPPPFHETLSESELAAGLFKLAPELARCARKGKERGHAKLLIDPDGTVTKVKLYDALPGTAVGKCTANVLRKARYPKFFGPPIYTRHAVP